MHFRMSTPGKVIMYIFLVLIVILTLVPLIYTAGASVKTNFEIAQGGIKPFPEQPTLDNFKQVWGMNSVGLSNNATYADYTKNSVLVSLLTVCFVVFFTSMSAYCFQRGNFPGRDILYWIFMGTMFVAAGSVTMFPLMQITSKLGLNNRLGVAIVQFATAGASNLFLTMGYLKTISKEIDDAARIDGCSFIGTYFRVILPLSKPILATIALMAFRHSWNNFLMPRLMLADAKISTLVVQVVKLRSSGGEGITSYNLMLTGTVFAAVPMIIIFLFFNRWFVSGITAGSVKG